MLLLTLKMRTTISKGRLFNGYVNHDDNYNQTGGIDGGFGRFILILGALRLVGRGAFEATRDGITEMGG
jgi:hypothetical protein